MKRSHKAILGTLMLLAVGVGGYWLGRSLIHPPLAANNMDVIPSERVVVNPNADKPGDPKNAEQDMKRIYAAILAFRSKYGRLPTKFELAVPEQREKAGINLNEDDFRVPDANLSDGYSPKDKTIHYTILTDEPRPDGTPKPATPGSGERDVWVTCEKYVRNKQVMYPDGHSDMDYGGNKVVLWSDGQVELVPPSALVLVAHSKIPNAMVEEIPGQAGLPKTTKSLKDLLTKDGKDTFNKTRIR